ncbi:flagellar protein FliO/FliZ [Geomicrobium halophilum]|uniref:Flagellar protein FliO/FliZ n=1 Tax=Geomicrobium halophilum TaxID=549000 RepID=A0A841PKM3_9BACL|nr:flagellar biosynthetic protein FliO [Geomicrobium halophilum]MBB6449289.1 flagellar protein FliO/FliZ [Geomicrobium halophilum]
MKICKVRIAIITFILWVSSTSAVMHAETSVLDSIENHEEKIEGVHIDEESSNIEASASDGQSMWNVLFQLGLALGAVIFVMFFLLKLLAKRTNRFQSTKTMQNLGGIGLGQQKSVQLIRVGDRLLVVGVGQSIQLLQEISDEKEARSLMALAESSTTTDFTDKAFALIKREKTKRDHHDQTYGSFHEQLDVYLRDTKNEGEIGFDRSEGRN